MKKFLLGFAALVLITSCSEDEGSSSSSFNSQIMVDGEQFTPGVNADPMNYVVTTLTENVNNGEANVRTFHLINAGTTLESLEALQISVNYPSAQSSINGTYSFDFDDAEINNMAQGAFMAGTTGYSIGAGTVTVTDLGSNQFKLEFSNVIATNFQNDEEITISGYGQGAFFVEEN